MGVKIFDLPNAIFKALLTAVFLLIPSVVFSVFSWPLSLMVMAMLAVMCELFLTKRLKNRAPLRSGYVLAFLLFIPGVFFIGITERQGAAGPFYASPIFEYSGLTETPVFAASQSGQIFILNREPQESPIIFFKNNQGAIDWAAECDISAQITGPGEESLSITRIDNPVVKSGFFRDLLTFDAIWSYGAKSGRAYIYKIGGSGVQRFYLSW